MMRIRLAVSENVLADPSRITAAMYEDYLDAHGRGWVCERNAEIIGFCYAAREDASIWALFVLPGHEGHGAGQGLLKRAVDWLAGLGHDRIVLSTTPGTRADRFYQAQGWTRGAVKDGEVTFQLRIGR